MNYIQTDNPKQLTSQDYELLDELSRIRPQHWQRRARKLLSKRRHVQKGYATKIHLQH